MDDPRRLLEKLREALGEVQEPEAQLASKAFILMAARTGAAPLPGLPPRFRPTTSQQRAMQQALGNEVSYIIGPPGTGKTATLAAVAFALVKAGRTVLVAAHTNIAVDNAILKLAEYADGLPELQEGRIVRHGPPQLAAVRDHASIYPPNIAKRIGRDLDAQKAGIQAARATALAELQALHDAHGEEAQHWRDERGRLGDDITRMQAELGPLQQLEQARLAGLQAQLTQAAREVDTAEEQVNLAKKTLAQLVEQQSRLTGVQDRLQADEVAASARLTEAQRMHPVLRVVRRVSRERLLQHLSDRKQELWEVGQALEALRQPLASAHAERARAEKAHSRAQTRCAAVLDELRRPSEFAARLQELLQALQDVRSRVGAGDAWQRRRTQERDAQQRRLRQDIERLNADLAHIETRLADLERDIVAHAQVVTTTLSKLYMGTTLRDRTFDVVILDEVSIAPLPAVYIAAALAKGRVVVIGDPKQLSPIVQAENDPLARKWLGRDLFEVARVTLDGAVNGDARSVLLDEQFRMDPAISIIARTHVYEGLLRDGEQQQEVSPAYASVLPLPGKPLVLCDTSDAHPLTAQPESGRGRYNEHHVMCVLALAKRALSTLPPALLSNGTAKFRIGIVTRTAPRLSASSGCSRLSTSSSPSAPGLSTAFRAWSLRS